MERDKGYTREGERERGREKGYPDKKIYVPWVPKIAHKSLTPGHPAGRPPPPHRTVTGQTDLCLCSFSFPELHTKRLHRITIGVEIPSFYIRGFEKGLADRGGWREEILAMPEIQASFLHPFSCSSLRKRWAQFWGTIFAAFGGLSVANPLPPTPFRNL